jgi:hypothetical protein
MNGGHARAVRAKSRELEAHRRAIGLQEKAVILFERAGQPVFDENARRRARQAQERLELGLREQRDYEAAVAGWQREAMTTRLLSLDEDRQL